MTAEYRYATLSGFWKEEKQLQRQYKLVCVTKVKKNLFLPYEFTCVRPTIPPRPAPTHRAVLVGSSVWMPRTEGYFCVLSAKGEVITTDKWVVWHAQQAWAFAKLYQFEPRT
jgi:hypothetical protein